MMGEGGAGAGNYNQPGRLGSYDRAGRHDNGIIPAQLVRGELVPE
jgi:hypothetical protein